MMEFLEIPVRRNGPLGPTRPFLGIAIGVSPVTTNPRDRDTTPVSYLKTVV